ncbi:hypothetical protein GXW83_05330 [Streptacidiphilus sp. PB12-B1b]|uniref:hypothetical protein n=1 Tax=Streptacidiphilus sp. PB12-B1b TaxID=2705012 RepID=UPI0015FC5675|nr:hypothetical protein [Streptacidiphilus sp. PB12-B1b]QMU75268.1 hypothetical protein GXW83_05330 [Streptacidiphilus sp. PB12-B1b]
MDGSVLNIVLGVVSSAVSAALAWVVQASLRRRSLERKRAFFGMRAGTECLIVAPRKAGTTAEDRVIAQRDVYAMMELAALVRECGAEAEIIGANEVRQGVGGRAEFSIGGPSANERTAAHLRWRLPGVVFRGDWEAGINELVIGDRVYAREKGVVEYVLLARITGGEGERPTFLVCGQTANSNLAAVRVLARRYRELIRAHGPHGTFALMLRVIQPGSYGADVVEFVGDVTAQASAPRPVPGAAPGQEPADAA